MRTTFRHTAHGTLPFLPLLACLSQLHLGRTPPFLGRGLGNLGLFPLVFLLLRQLLDVGDCGFQLVEMLMPGLQALFRLHLVRLGFLEMLGQRLELLIKLSQFGLAKLPLFVQVVLALPMLLQTGAQVGQLFGKNAQLLLRVFVQLLQALQLLAQFVDLVLKSG
ncbi:hypothetical protein HRbin36_02368 [bacterium HR36]|nr:hypothetical protein HRbin36_02368 [bacterium HR36]